MIKKLTPVLLLGVFLLSSVNGQIFNPKQIELAERLDFLASKAAPEIAYVQTSKDIYEAGEDLWFKVYLLNSQTLIPSLLSKTLYLQLLNEKGKAVWQEKYEIQNGFANGQVFIENTLPPGDYLLTVYTCNSFFHDTSEFKAVRRIKVVSDIISSPLTASKLNAPLCASSKMQFTTFPEGGNLVSGIQNKIAFKAVSKDGLPVEINGTLFEDTIPLIKFTSIHAGMGRFIFTPDSTKKYFIKISKPSIDSNFYLPHIYPKGMALQLVKRDKESLSFKISQSSGFEPSDIYFRVQCRGIVYGMATAKLEKELLIKVPLVGLPQGIAEVTLFNANLDPIAERLVYINLDQKLNITTDLNKDIYSTRGKVSLKISVKDENGQPVVANLGVTVFDKLYQNSRDSNSILAHYYLSTQLKGNIYNPWFYFNSLSKGRDEALDLLMLTQGWRKYFWNESNLEKLGESREQIIHDGLLGEITTASIWKNKSRHEQAFVMANSSKMDNNLLISSDSLGSFIVTPKYLKLFEGDYVYLKPFGKDGSNATFKITDPFETINLVMKKNEISYPLPSLIFLKVDTQALSVVRSDHVRIKDVTIKAQNSNTFRGKYMGKLDSLSKLEIRPVTGAVTGDYVCKNLIWNCKNHSSSDLGSTEPIPGKRYYDNNGLSHMVNRLPSQEYTEEELLKKFNLLRVKAYYGNPEFYQPNYDKETDEVFIPDFRNTLLWEPSIFTNYKGEATLSFYCSDINTDFIGIIEGAGGEGLLGTHYFKFKVRKLKPNP
jgi:hypothetical protein